MLRVSELSPSGSFLAHEGENYDDPDKLISALAQEKIADSISAQKEKRREEKVRKHSAQAQGASNFKTFLHHIQKKEEYTCSKTEKDAICLEQDMVAFSNSAPMNVSNLQQCIFTVISDPSSDFAAGMHISLQANVENIPSIITSFLKEKGVPEEQWKTYPLNCRFVGGDIRSTDLFRKIFTQLTNFNITVGSSNLTFDTWEDDRPSEISYDPKSKKFYQAITSYSDKLRINGMLSLNFGSDEGKLHIVSSQKDDKRIDYPIPFNEEKTGKLLEFATDAESDLVYFENMIQDSESRESLIMDSDDGTCTFLTLAYYSILFASQSSSIPQTIEFSSPDDAG